jgi:hypothetical protein
VTLRAPAIATTLAIAGTLALVSTAQGLPSTIVTADNAVGAGYANCPALSRVAAGGFSGGLGGRVTGNLAPTSSLRGWSVLVDGDEAPASGTTYAVCTTGDVTLAVNHALLSFTYIPDFMVVATASCSNPLARVVGGGFQSTSASNANPTTESYPSGPRSWRVRVEAASLRDIPQGYAFAYCSLTALGTTIRQGAGTVGCGSGTQVFGGGWSGGEATASFPSGARSWTSVVPSALPGATPVTYAICGS